jgi:hypothetical protein
MNHRQYAKNGNHAKKNIIDDLKADSPPGIPHNLMAPFFRRYGIWQIGTQEYKKRKSG